MPNLRELLRIVEEQGAKSYSPAAYAVMEALVEKVEALVKELEAQRPPQVDARIAALTADRDSWERQCRNAERGLAEAKAEIDAQASRIRGLEAAIRGYESNHGACGDYAADAEIGRLVWGMRRGSQLHHPGLLEGWVGLDFTIRRQAEDPAEALRAIQKGGRE